jgi:hypothetical protein
VNRLKNLHIPLKVTSFSTSCITKLLTGRTLLQRAVYLISKSEMYQIKFTAIKNILVLYCIHFFLLFIVFMTVSIQY